MKQYLLPAAAVLALTVPMSCTGDGNTATTDSTSTVTTTTSAAADGSVTRRHTIIETETYTDLGSGRTFRIKRDDAGNYTTENGEALTYYYSPSTQDTFYGPSGRWVNGALNYDPASGYSIDEQRAAMADENFEKIKSTDEEFKAKTEDGGKVKITADGSKIKANENELKVKGSDGSKLKANEDEVKIKNADGSKVKMNEDETKIKR